MRNELTCPNCGCDHLHASVMLGADDEGARFVVLGPSPGEPDHVLVRSNPAGPIQADEVVLQCCACDYNASRFIRFVDC